jgi:hypothetical protein
MIKPLLAASLCIALAACATAQRQQPVPDQQQQVSLPPAPRPGEPSDIVDMQEAQLRTAFGTPALVREDGHNQMWRYDGPSCKAFFFLYPAGNSLAVRHVETVPRGREIAADFGCLNALRERAGTAPVS